MLETQSRNAGEKTNPTFGHMEPGGSFFVDSGFVLGFLLGVP